MKKSIPKNTDPKSETTNIQVPKKKKNKSSKGFTKKINLIFVLVAVTLVISATFFVLNKYSEYNKLSQIEFGKPFIELSDYERNYIEILDAKKGNHDEHQTYQKNVDNNFISEDPKPSIEKEYKLVKSGDNIWNRLFGSETATAQTLADTSKINEVTQQAKKEEVDFVIAVNANNVMGVKPFLPIDYLYINSYEVLAISKEILTLFQENRYSEIIPYVKQDSLIFFKWNLDKNDFRDTSWLEEKFHIVREFDMYVSPDQVDYLDDYQKESLSEEMIWSDVLMEYKDKAKVKTFNFHGNMYYPAAGFGGGTIDVPSGLTTIVTVPYDADENGWSTVKIWFEFTKVEGEISLVKFGFWM